MEYLGLLALIPVVVLLIGTARGQKTELKRVTETKKERAGNKNALLTVG